jgi:ankyrin repeat protein
MRRYRAAFLTLLLMAVLVAVSGFWLRSAQRQYALNRQLIAALKQENDQWALALIKAGADPNTPIRSSPPPSFQQLWSQLLHRSRAPDDDNRTALVGMGWYEKTTAVALLKAMLDHGGDINARDIYGYTLLSQAIMRENRQAILLLVSRGVRLDSQDSFGSEIRYHNNAGAAVLNWAAAHNDLEVMNLMLNRGVNIDALGGLAGWTALMEAVSGCHVEATRFLLQHHANVYWRIRMGASNPPRYLTALKLATLRSQHNPQASRSIIRMLMEAKAKE